jgi:microcystin-dependent protein
MPQTPVDNTQPSLALTQAFVTAGVFPPRDASAGGAFLDEIFTFAFNFAPPGGTLSANGQLLSIAQNEAVFSLIGTTYGGNGTTNFAIPNLGGATMIGTGQGPGLSPENLGVPDGTPSVTLTLPELPPDLGGTSQSFSNYQPSLPVTYMICVQGTFPSQSGGGGGQDLIGAVMPFAANFVPTDYLPADGRLLSIAQNQTLFSLLGTTYGGDGITTFALPDLRGRTIIGASTTDPLGTLVGSPTVSLSNSQAPNGFGNTVQPFDNREPSLALNYVISLFGIFPNLNGSNVVDPNTPFLGEVKPFAGNFAPSGWALCNGQLLPISQNTALFSLLGTTYGGNGITTFALPDLRDRTVVGTGNGVTIGSQLGASFPTVTAAELPLPDLVVAGIAGNASVTQGATYSFTYTVANIGAGAAGMSWAGIYLDQQTTTLPGGWNQIGALNANASATATNSFSTAGLAGVHTLWIKADYWNDATGMANSGNNDVVESNENNNWLSLSFNVTAPPLASSSSMNLAAASPPSANVPLAVAPGATVEISSAFDKPVAFLGDTGTLELDDPSSFSGTVAGMSGQDTIDLANISFATVQSPTYSGDSSGGTLAVTDGTHTANIALLGNYLASTFVTSSDGHGGTFVTDPPADSSTAVLIQPPHA